MPGYGKVKSLVKKTKVKPAKVKAELKIKKNKKTGY